MTTKADFTPEEWATLRRGIVAGEEAVRAAAPSGWYGRLKESRALKREWKTILEIYGDTELARDLVGTDGDAPIEPIELKEGEAGEFIEANLQACRDAARIITSKGDPRQAEIYGNVVLHLAETAAMAHGGNAETQAAEALVLRRIAAAFGRTDYEPGAPTTLTGDTLMNERALQSSQQYE